MSFQRMFDTKSKNASPYVRIEGTVEEVISSTYTKCFLDCCDVCNEDLQCTCIEWKAESGLCQIGKRCHYKSSSVTDDNTHTYFRIPKKASVEIAQLAKGYVTHTQATKDEFIKRWTHFVDSMTSTDSTTDMTSPPDGKLTQPELVPTEEEPNITDEKAQQTSTLVSDNQEDPTQGETGDTEKPFVPSEKPMDAEKTVISSSSTSIRPSTSSSSPSSPPSSSPSSSSPTSSSSSTSKISSTPPSQSTSIPSSSASTSTASTSTLEAEKKTSHPHHSTTTSMKDGGGVKEDPEISTASLSTSSASTSRSSTSQSASSSTLSSSSQGSAGTTSSSTRSTSIDATDESSTQTSDWPSSSPSDSSLSSTTDPSEEESTTPDERWTTSDQSTTTDDPTSSPVPSTTSGASSSPSTTYLSSTSVTTSITQTTTPKVTPPSTYKFLGVTVSSEIVCVELTKKCSCPDGFYIRMNATLDHYLSGVSATYLPGLGWVMYGENTFYIRYGDNILSLEYKELSNFFAINKCILPPIDKGVFSDTSIICPNGFKSAMSTIEGKKTNEELLQCKEGGFDSGKGNIKLVTCK